MLSRKMYILERMPLAKMWITHWERWEWYKARAEKASLKAPTGIRVSNNEAAKEMEKLKRQNYPPSNAVSDGVLAVG